MKSKMRNDEIVTEVRKNREELLEEHGGIKGYLKYLQAQHSRWESEGFCFVSHEEVLRRQRQEESVKTAETL
jgi:predicted sulfurtransferase